MDHVGASAAVERGRFNSVFSRLKRHCFRLKGKQYSAARGERFAESGAPPPASHASRREDKGKRSAQRSPRRRNHGSTYASGRLTRLGIRVPCTAR